MRAIWSSNLGRIAVFSEGKIAHFPRKPVPQLQFKKSQTLKPPIFCIFFPPTPTYMKKAFLPLLLILLCIPAFAQSLSDYLSAPFPTGLVASPDGNSIAWVFNDKGERNVFFAKSPDYTAKKITDYPGDNGVGIAQLTFSPDSKTLLFRQRKLKKSSRAGCQSSSASGKHRF
jgi:hypothetical protein